MRRKKNNKLVLVLVALILFLGLGYALLTQDLTINGTTKVKGNNWDIHFNNVQITTGSVALSTGDSAASIDTNDNTLVNFTITLNQPGDFYEFTVDAVNAGTVDGMVGEVIPKLNGTAISSTNPLPVYLDYTFSYADGTLIAPNHLLEAGNTETFKVRIEFKRDIENSELPSTEQTKTFSFGISYVQSDGDAIAVPHMRIVYTPFTINKNEGIRIGEAIPNSITQYDSYEDMKNSSFGEDYLYNTYAFKHKVVNNIVVETSIEFVITPAHAATYTNYVPGTYIVTGDALCTCDANTNVEICENEDSQFFASNVETLKNAFGEENCSLSHYNDVDYYSCGYPFFVTSKGDIQIEFSSRRLYIEYGEANSFYAD